MTLTSLSINVLPLETTAPSFLPSPSAFTALLEKHNAASASPALPKIKAIVLVTPNNPTGSIYPIDLVWQFARICAAWKVACIVDETYRDFLLDESVQTSSPLPLARPHDLFDRDAHPDFQWQNSACMVGRGEQRENIEPDCPRRVCPS